MTSITLAYAPRVNNLKMLSFLAIYHLAFGTLMINAICGAKYLYMLYL